MADIESGRVNTVVVYKVDRLTRSLRDFAKIVDVFDAQSVSFVSVTQQFNTTTSMGRLTLHMLLSFAQFEREVTGERIRDKIAASKRKGMWMGGFPPLGYDPKDRKLVVNPGEAEAVREIFSRYIELGSVYELKVSLDRDGYVTKRRINKYGRPMGGKMFSRGALYQMLQNRIYRGEIVHRDNTYPGEHEAIVDEDLWNAVQKTRKKNRIEREAATHARSPSLLTGLIYDAAGERMTPTHASRKGKRYRYYVSQSLTTERRANRPTGWRVPARDLEELVCRRVQNFLANESNLFSALETVAPEIKERMRYIAEAGQLAEQWSTLQQARKRVLVRRLVSRVDLNARSVAVAVDVARLPTLLADPGDAAPVTSSWQESAESLTSQHSVVLTASTQIKRAGMEMRLIVEGKDSEARTSPDECLHRLLAQAYRYRGLLMNSRGKTIGQLAAEADVCGSHFTRLLKVSFLSPEIVDSILRDQHPLALNAKRVSRDTDLPVSWLAQSIALNTE